jgi:hypothetical protein
MRSTISRARLILEFYKLRKRRVLALTLAHCVKVQDCCAPIPNG